MTRTAQLQSEVALLASNCSRGVSRGSLRSIVEEGRSTAAAGAGERRESSRAAPLRSIPEASAKDTAALRAAVLTLLEALEGGSDSALCCELRAWLANVAPVAAPAPVRSSSTTLLDDAIEEALASTAGDNESDALLGDALDDLIDADASLGARSAVVQLAEAALRLGSAPWVLLAVRLLLLTPSEVDNCSPLMKLLREKEPPARLLRSPSVESAAAALPLAATDAAAAACAKSSDSAASATMPYGGAALAMLVSLGRTAASYVEGEAAQLYSASLSRAVAPPPSAPRAILLAWSVARALLDGSAADGGAAIGESAARAAGLFSALCVLRANCESAVSAVSGGVGSCTDSSLDGGARASASADFSAAFTPIGVRLLAIAEEPRALAALGVSDAAMACLRAAALHCWGSGIPLLCATRVARLRFVARASEDALANARGSHAPSPRTLAIFRWAASARGVRSLLLDYGSLTSTAAAGADVDLDGVRARLPQLGAAVRALVALAGAVPTFAGEGEGGEGGGAVGPLAVLVALRSALLSAASACFVARVRAVSFDSKRSARHALLSRCAVDADAASGEVAKISHGGTSGAWTMSIASDGFAPMTGRHVWRVKVNRCVKNHIFVGVATAKARPEGYLGSNSETWGVIGTREVWHAALKLRSDYGGVFRQGAHLEIDYDSDRGTLSVQRVCGDLTLREVESGVRRSNAPAEFAFVKMPRHETLYPAGALTYVFCHVERTAIPRSCAVESPLSKPREFVLTFLLSSSAAFSSSSSFVLLPRSRAAEQRGLRIRVLPARPATVGHDRAHFSAARARKACVRGDVCDGARRPIRSELGRGQGGSSAGRRGGALRRGAACIERCAQARTCRDVPALVYPRRRVSRWRRGGKRK